MADIEIAPTTANKIKLCNEIEFIYREKEGIWGEYFCGCVEEPCVTFLELIKALREEYEGQKRNNDDLGKCLSGYEAWKGKFTEIEIMANRKLNILIYLTEDVDIWIKYEKILNSFKTFK